MVLQTHYDLAANVMVAADTLCMGMGNASHCAGQIAIAYQYVTILLSE